MLIAKYMYSVYIEGFSHLPLTVMLSPKKVQIPSDMVREQMTVMTDVNPSPILERTRSILPEGESKMSCNTRRV